MHTYKNNNVLPSLLYKTNTRINSFRVTNKDILSLIILLLLDSSTCCGYDNISVKMIRTCGESLTISWEVMFERPLMKRNIFRNIKKTNVVPIQKKRKQKLNKQLPSILVCIQFLVNYLTG